MSINAMKQALDTLENVEYSGCDEHEIIEAIESLRQAIAEAEKEERNFCPRCGKRTKDIHTCTPPKGKA